MSYSVDIWIGFCAVFGQIIVLPNHIDCVIGVWSACTAALSTV